MSKYVIHKKAFFYTDESFEVAEGERGSVVGVYTSLEEAKTAKERADIESILGLRGWNAIEFFFDKDIDAIIDKLRPIYEEEFGIVLQDDYDFNFPESMTAEHAATFREIMQLSFHDIVLYEDHESLPGPVNLEEQDLGEF
ncbi:hypothetical protein ACFQ21_11850 [Ohtaekwangia kribbensis]|jgi:hypothetical protein|uniref:Uncharacterized protein n=1 Tax=Ohtaekwangia kribbensis TaxID=688913 RepID=A0ABW3K3H5_9BACT